MAAAVVLCMALMVGAQAAGADVFGALARWTDPCTSFFVYFSGSGLLIQHFIERTRAETTFRRKDGTGQVLPLIIMEALMPLLPTVPNS